jgi:hypothetical protein
VFIAAGDEDGAEKVFGVEFDVLIDDLNRKLDRRKRWVFDGRWLVEQDFSSKSYVRREIAREGDDADPMALGEGPLPIPIGQRKAAILERYRVSMPAVTEGLTEAPDAYSKNLGAGFVSAVEGRAVQLLLLPREAQPGGFDEIRLWYSRGGEGAGSGDGGRLLPMLAKATKRGRDGAASDEAWVFLSGVATNVGLGRASVLAPPPEGEGWSVDVRRLDEASGGAGGTEGEGG